MAEYISIAEAARRANISKQAIYQRLNKDLNKYVKVIDGKKQLHTDCLEILLKHVDSSSQQDCSTSLNQIIEVLRSQLEVKDEQIAEKDKQIKSLQELLKASNALMAGNIQVLLNQSQTTEEPAASKKEEESSSPPTPPPPPSSEPAADTPAQNKVKQSFWQRFFG